MRKAAVVASEALWKEGHGPYHPLKPERLKRTWDLLHAYHAFDAPNSQLAAPRMATDEELGWFHTPEYIDAVRRLGRGDKSVSPWMYGFGPGDNPVFPDMYEVEALKTGAGLVAAEWVISGQVDVAFSYSGGMHHAAPARAFGFCVFNDPAVVIHRLLREGLRVAYIDIDAHHGDGVQNAFYDSEQVLTISLHESGRYLFPGTGYVLDRGTGSGKGYAVNIPLPPQITDAPYLWAFRELVPPLVQRFAPDVVVSQLGVDTHYLDPLTHLALTLDGYVSVVEEIARLSPRWVALGGGGYAVSVVPRAWTLAYGVMSEQQFADELPPAYAAAYEAGTLRDHEAPMLDERAESAVRGRVEAVVEEVKGLFGL